MTGLQFSTARGGSIAEIASVLVIAATFVVPWVSQNPMVYSLVN
jgi:branched-chain amino acid transport system permease protein